MNSSKYIFTLDLRSVQSQITLPVTQGDTNRTLIVSFSDGAKPFILEEGTSAMMSVVRPTGTFMQEYCEVEEGGACVKYHFSEHTSIVPGLNKCQLVILNGAGKQIASPNFSLDIAPKLVDGNDVVIPDEDLVALDVIYQREAARQEAEAKRATAEVLRDDAERQRESDAREAIKEVTELTESIEQMRDNGDFNGKSPTVNVEDTDTGTRITFEDINGSQTVEVEDGTPATHKWEGTTLTITSASGTSSVNLKGSKGEKGETGEKGEKGDKGDKGDGIQIYRTFPSVAEMFAGVETDGVPEGAFVIISNDDENDPENARLYVKNDTTYQFISDLSGQQGIQGPKGDAGEDGEDGLPGVYVLAEGEILDDVPEEITVVIDPNGEAGAIADYEQNDPEHPEYIKGRPCYVVPSYRELLPVTNLPFLFLSEKQHFVFQISTADASELVSLWNSDWDEVILALDGVEYKCTPRYHEGVKYIGNEGAMESGFENTSEPGEPFVMYCSNAFCFIYDIDTPGTQEGDVVYHNLGLSLLTETVKKLDSKFIDFAPIAEYIENYINEALGGEY